MKKRIICYILAFVLAIQAFPNTYSHLAENEIDKQIISEEDEQVEFSEQSEQLDKVSAAKRANKYETRANLYACYTVRGYNDLINYSNGESRQALYIAIRTAARNFHKSGENAVLADNNYIAATIDTTEYGLTSNEQKEVFYAFYYDNPQFYWLDYKYVGGGNELSLAVAEDYAEFTNRYYYNSILEKNLTTFKTITDNLTSNYDIALKIHDYIISSCTPAEEGNADEQSALYNVVGIMDSKVRSGYSIAYARAFQLIMNYFNIPNAFVAGNDGTHFWNMVKLDNSKYYYIDLSWDDMSDEVSGISYNYFCGTKADFADSHTPYLPSGTGSDFLYVLPTAASTAYTDTAVTLKKGDTFSDSKYNYTVIINTNSHHEVAITSEVSAPTTSSVTLNGSVTYKNVKYTVTTIEDDVFANEKYPIVTKVTIGSGIKYVGNNLFAQSSNIATLVIPASVQKIGDVGVLNNLTTLTLSSASKYFVKVGNALYNKDKTKLVLYVRKAAATTFTVPSTVTEIGGNALRYCTKLTTVNLPQSLETIGDYAFANCSALTKITIPDSVYSLGEGAFSGCKKLSYVTIGAGIDYLDAYMFTNCTALTKFTVSGENTEYTSVDGVLFSMDKISLVCYPCGKTATSYTVPSTVKYIEDGAFDYTTKLATLTLGKSVKSLANINCFVSSSISKFVVNSANTSMKAVSGVLLTYSGKTLVHYPVGKTTTTYTLPSTVITIAPYAFYTAKKLVNIKIPTSVTSIGECSFNKCTALTKITIPKQTTTIYTNSFEGSTKVKIYCLKGSKAHRVAKANAISYQVTNGSKISSCKITFTSTSGNVRYYIGSAIKPGLLIKYGTTTLVKGKDYTVAYSNNTNTGKGKIVITGIGEYTGTKTLYFYIRPRPTTVTATSTLYGTLKASWKKSVGATGYQVAIYDGLKNGCSVVRTVTGASTLSYVENGFISGKTYYIKVRSYKTIDGKRYYSAYSTVKTIKSK